MSGLAEAVAKSLEALKLAPECAGAAELARQLAEEVDRARAAEAVADRVLRDAELEPELEDMVRALKAKVSHRDAIVRCGQRLESVLGALGATPAARGKAPAQPLNGPLALLRGGAAG